MTRFPLSRERRPAAAGQNRPSSSAGSSPRRRLGLLAGGLAGTALVVIAEPLGPADPFRSTLLILPLVVAALVGLHDWALGGARRRPATGEAVALAVLLLATVARDRLGLNYPERWLEAMLAAGFLLLLARRTGRIVLAARRLLDGSRGGSPSPLFLLLPLVVYLAILPWSTERRPPNGDEPYYLLVSHSLAYDFDAELANNYAAADSLAFMDRRLEPQPFDPVGPHGEVYSRHNLALPLMLAPFYRLGGKFGVLAVMALIAAAVAWMALKLARLYYPELAGEALLAWALLAFAPPLLFYSGQVWVEVPAALLVLLALHRIGKLEREPTRLAHWLLLAAILALLPLLKLRFLLVTGPLFVLAAWRSRKGLRFLIQGAGVLAALGSGILVYNAIAFGRPLKTHSWTALTHLFSVPPSQYARGVLGLLFDTAFGLAGWAPLWLLLVPALLLLVRRRQRLGLDLGVALTLYFLILAPRGEWYGAWSPPFRYGMVALPALAIALVPLLAERRRWNARFLIAALSAVTLALAITGTALPNWTYSFADGRSHLLDQLTMSLGADAGRFFPSFVRFRTATWLWPAIALPALPLLWWTGRRRPRGAAGLALAGLLAACALPAALADRLTTTVIEAEDPYVEPRGGSLFPERWTPTRLRYSSGWLMAAGDRLVAPVTAGGELVVLEVEVEASEVRQPGLRVVASAGDEELASWYLSRIGARRHLRSGRLAWPAGRPLVLSVDARGRGGSKSRLLIDRVRLRWLDPPGDGAPAGPEGEPR